MTARRLRDASAALGAVVLCGTLLHHLVATPELTGAEACRHYLVPLLIGAALLLMLPAGEGS